MGKHTGPSNMTLPRNKDEPTVGMISGLIVRRSRHGAKTRQARGEEVRMAGIENGQYLELFGVAALFINGGRLSGNKMRRQRSVK
jgi:hypothetical protein